MAFKNTWQLREAAIFFKKQKELTGVGRYDAGLKGTKQYKDYWLREKKRCIEGYTAPCGIEITGMHYEYLNYSMIEIVVERDRNKDDEEDDEGTTVDADRFPDFPDFWDEDYKYFWLLHIVKHGIKIEKLRELEKWWDNDIQKFNLIETKENLRGGKHLCWLKPRGMGASWKAAEIPTHRYFHGESNKTFMFAENTTFLNDDGLFNKFLFKMDFINTYTEFRQPNDFKKSRDKMHFRASYDDNGTEAGLMNEVSGMSLKDNPEGARGKRGYILWEEIGKFKGFASAYNIALKSVSQDGAVFATNVAFGTGGLDKKNFEDLESMFYDPDSYDMLKFNNIYDDGRINTHCCYFTPAYINPRHKDKDGNSDLVEGKRHLEKVRAKKAKSPNPNALGQEKTEKPYTPAEALLNVVHNLFPAAELQAWKTNILTTAKKNFGIGGRLERERGVMTFKPDSSLVPVVDFPLKHTTNLDGCIVQYESPYREHGVIPEGLYIICVDPYGGDRQGGGIKSLGVCYVIKNINKMSKPDNIIVASYISRPKNTEYFYDNLFNLAELYNAKIGFENDRGEGLMSYAKAKKKLNFLIQEFTLDFNENIPAAKSRGGFGMHIGSGKDNVRKNIGEKYVDEWLREIRNVTADGEYIYGYHGIYDVGLLEELSKYGIGNFDRVSALIIGMYTMKELNWKDTKKQQNRKNKTIDQLLGARLYQ